MQAVLWAVTFFMDFILTFGKIVVEAAMSPHVMGAALNSGSKHKCVINTQEKR